MALQGLKILRNCELIYLRARKIMTSSFNLKKVEKELEENPYFNKYQKKIEKLRKERPEQYYAGMKAKEEQKKIDARKKKKSVKDPEPKNESKSEGIQRCLGDILKLEMIENKSAEEVKQIWMDYHKGKDFIYSTFSYEQYNKLSRNFSKYPTFVFPLPRGDGYEFFLFQHSDNELHFTPLVQFKKHGANAPECLTVVYFPELQDKNLVLMRGENDKAILSSLEAQCLLNITHIFYNGESGKLSEMVELFNKRPEEFKFAEIISEVERIGFNLNTN